jgi:L-amino acid N-acyltransferase YncA
MQVKTKRGDLLGSIQLIEFDTKIIEGLGSYCLRSKKKSDGYISKNNWLTKRFEEGLRYVQLFENNKQVGFIEYTEAEYSYRVVHAADYLVIHCLWVSVNGKGYGTKLINHCIEEAKKQSKNGAVVVTNSDTSWAPSKNIFLKNDFKLVDNAPNNFELLVYKINSDAQLPSFPTNWDERLAQFQKLTILRSFQCPYVDIATENVVSASTKLGLDVNVIELENRDELMELSPTPYGIFSVVFKGQLISFHRLTIHTFIKRLRELI